MGDQRQSNEMLESSRHLPTLEEFGFYHARSLRTVSDDTFFPNYS